MILFGFAGATGAVNAGNNLNYVVHNTAWVPGHLHLTVGTAVALTFMGLSYLLLPQLTGRKLHSRRLALVQVYLWFFGMVVFSAAMHYLGVLGSPRRTYDVTFGGAAVAQEWSSPLAIAAVGGVLLFTSVALFLYNVFRTLTSGTKVEISLPEAEAPQGSPGMVDNFRLFTAIALLLVLVAYVLPTVNIISLGTPGAPPVAIQ
jgi:cytochrome c oxidase subunit 1